MYYEDLDISEMLEDDQITVEEEAFLFGYAEEKEETEDSEDF